MEQAGSELFQIQVKSPNQSMVQESSRIDKNLSNFLFQGLSCQGGVLVLPAGQISLTDSQQIRKNNKILIKIFSFFQILLRKEYFSKMTKKITHSNDNEIDENSVFRFSSQNKVCFSDS
jgi:hypothetical protein